MTLYGRMLWKILNHSVCKDPRDGLVDPPRLLLQARGIRYRYVPRLGKRPTFLKRVEIWNRTAYHWAPLRPQTKYTLLTVNNLHTTLNLQIQDKFPGGDIEAKTADIHMLLQTFCIQGLLKKMSAGGERNLLDSRRIFMDDANPKCEEICYLPPLDAADCPAQSQWRRETRDCEPCAPGFHQPSPGQDHCIVSSISAPLSRTLLVSLVLGGAIFFVFLLLLPSVWKLEENQREKRRLQAREQKTIQLAEDLGFLKFEAVAYLDTLPHPTPTEVAFSRLTKMLKANLVVHQRMDEAWNFQIKNLCSSPTILDATIPKREQASIHDASEEAETEKIERENLGHALTESLELEEKVVAHLYLSFSTSWKESTYDDLILGVERTVSRAQGFVEYRYPHDTLFSWNAHHPVKDGEKRALLCALQIASYLQTWGIEQGLQSPTWLIGLGCGNCLAGWVTTAFNTYPLLQGGSLSENYRVSFLRSTYRNKILMSERIFAVVKPWVCGRLVEIVSPIADHTLGIYEVVEEFFSTRPYRRGMQALFQHNFVQAASFFLEHLRGLHGEHKDWKAVFPL